MTSVDSFVRGKILECAVRRYEEHYRRKAPQDEGWQELMVRSEVKRFMKGIFGMFSFFKGESKHMNYQDLSTLVEDHFLVSGLDESAKFIRGWYKKGILYTPRESLFLLRDTVSHYYFFKKGSFTEMRQ